MFILASSSPRRKTLLKKLVKNFKVITPNVVERNFEFSATNYPLELSKLKAYSVFSKHPNDTVLACDTVVYFNKKIVNKPRNSREAREMLEMLSGKTHHVITGYTIINKHKEINRQVVSAVTFHKLSKKLIDEYVAGGYAIGKAGAYGAQDHYPLVKKIEGSYYNVVGLPIEDIKKHLK